MILKLDSQYKKKNESREYDFNYKYFIQMKNDWTIYCQTSLILLICWFDTIII